MAQARPSRAPAQRVALAHASLLQRSLVTPQWQPRAVALSQVPRLGQAQEHEPQVETQLARQVQRGTNATDHATSTAAEQNEVHLPRESAQLQEKQRLHHREQASQEQTQAYPPATAQKKQQEQAQAARAQPEARHP